MNKSKILVAIRFDNSAEFLLKSAHSVSQRLGAELEAFHVSEYWVGRSWPSDGLMSNPLSDLAVSVEEQTASEARLYLQDLVKKHLPQTDVKSHVAVGFPVDEIRARAREIKASLIILGGFERDYTFIPRGVSTVLALQNESSCPVLVVPKDHKLNWTSKERLSVILADDLTSDSATTIARAFSVTKDLRSVDIKHVHVNGLQREDLKAALRQVSAAAHTPETALSGDVVWDSAMKAIYNALEKRGIFTKSSVSENGNSITPIVLHGEPKTEMTKFALEQKADLLIFGQHKTWHQKPLSLGRMPVHAMFQSGIPVLVICPE